MNDFVGYIDDEGNVFDGTFQYEGQVGPIGPQGIPGYTPQRGVDYWTESDQETIVTEATSLINGKIEEYNDNAAAKTEAFNDNASDKTTTFNSNFTSKMNKFNQNSGEQKADFNANALEKTGDFNTNAGDKTDAFDSHVTSKTTDFDSHVDDEFNELTGSFYTKSQTYSKDEVDGLISSTYHYKGSVTDYSYLPSSGQQVGDVYNLENAGGGYNAGDNVAWTGTDWDKLAGTVDLSNYYTKGQVDNIANTKQNVIDSSHKLLSDNVDDTNQTNKFVTSEEKTTWNNKSDFTGNYEDLNNKPDLTQYEEKSNKTNELSGNSTTTEYPNAKVVYDWLDSITPSNEVSGETIHVEDSSNLPIKDFAMTGNATQADTPTPEAPQDIHVVTGNNTVKVVGKNIFKPMSNSTTTKADVTITKNNDGSFSMSGIATSSTNMVIGSFSVCKDKYYAMSGIEGYTTSDVKISSSTGDAFPSGSILTEYVDAGNLRRIRQAQITEYDINVVVIITNGTNYNGVTIYPMIEQNNQVTTYEPYAEQTQLLSLGNIELAKIGDYTDRIFKAVQGNTIYDSLDNTTKASLTVGNWYKQGNIGKVIFTGAESENWKYDNGTHARFYLTYSDLALQLPNNTSALPITICNKLLSTNTQYIYDHTYDNAISGHNINHQFWVYMSQYTDLTSFRQWLSTATPNVLYIKATPTYTEITDTTLIGQLENVLKMHTYKNVTNGWIEPTGTNAQASMVLVYRQDIQTLITNNTNAILSL